MYSFKNSIAAFTDKLRSKRQSLEADLEKDKEELKGYRNKNRANTSKAPAGKLEVAVMSAVLYAGVAFIIGFVIYNIVMVSCLYALPVTFTMVIQYVGINYESQVLDMLVFLGAPMCLLVLLVGAADIFLIKHFSLLMLRAAKGLLRRKFGNDVVGGRNGAE